MEWNFTLLLKILAELLTSTEMNCRFLSFLQKQFHQDSWRILVKLCIFRPKQMFLREDLLILCPSMCICDVNDNCFTFSNTSDPTPLSLYSYCGADGCHRRAVLVSSIINVATNETLTMNDQFVNPNNAKPLTDQTYLKINRMSCSSCAIENTCASQSTCPATPTPSQIPTTPFPACQKPPANTSRIYIENGDGYIEFLSTPKGNI